MESEFLGEAEPSPTTIEQLEELSTEQLKQLCRLSHVELMRDMAPEPGGEAADSRVDAGHLLPEWLLRAPEKRERLRNLAAAITTEKRSQTPRGTLVLI